jgi:hypothetical protein
VPGTDGSPPAFDCNTFDPARTSELYGCFTAAGLRVAIDNSTLRVPPAIGTVPLGESETRVHAWVTFSNGVTLESQDEADATRLVTWSSSRADWVSVDAQGKVTVLDQASGSITLTARTLDGAVSQGVDVSIDDSGELDLIVE